MRLQIRNLDPKVHKRLRQEALNCDVSLNALLIHVLVETVKRWDRDDERYRKVAKA